MTGLAEDGRHASVADGAVEANGGRLIWVRPDGAETARLAALAADGALTVEISATYGLDEVAEAFASSREGHVRGKIVITPLIDEWAQLSPAASPWLLNDETAGQKRLTGVAALAAFRHAQARRLLRSRDVRGAPELSW